MKQFNNKILIAILLLLAVAFVFTKLFRSPARESNLEADLLKIDTSQVTEVKLHLPHHKADIQLMKEGKRWNAIQHGKTAATEGYPVNNLLQAMVNIKPERVVSRKKEKWDTYGVSDSTSIAAVVMAGSRELARWHIGKESEGLTYLRPAGEDNVYAVAGAPRVAFDKTFNDWRDKSLLRLKKDLITKISFQYPADSSFVLEKKDKDWTIGGVKADSAKVEKFLDKLRAKDHSAFADTYNATTPPDVTLTFFNGEATQATVKAWRHTFYQWILNSSQQPDVYFSDEGGVLARELLVSRKSF
jgi:hypothetical protein